jgi:hypothetical protein
MSRFRKISMSMWTDAKFSRLSKPAPNAQTLWVYLITGPFSTNIPGCVKGKPAVLAADLGWPLDALMQCMGELIREELLLIDFEVGLIWLPNAAKHNPPNSINAVKSWRSSWPELPECELKDKVFGTLREFAYGIGTPYGMAFEGIVNPSGTQKQKNEQKQKQNEAANRLWDLQETLRKEAIAGSRMLRATPERLERISNLLDAGNTEDDCAEVLRAYARESRANPKSAQWFNGETNWRKDNFDRTLGRIVNRFARGSSSPVAEARKQADDELPRVDLLSKWSQ